MSNGGEDCSILSFDHLVFWVANAKVTASYYVTRFGFKPLAVREPSDSNKNVAYVVKLNKIYLVFESASVAGGAVNEELGCHGDFVKDVALVVYDLEAAVLFASEAGAEVVRDVMEEADDDGFVRSAVLKTYGDTTHTLIDRSQYSGLFLPGFKPMEDDVLNNLLPDTGLSFIDHVESNMADKFLEESISWYERNLQMHRFWCVDYERNLTPYSCIRSLSVANRDETVLLQLNEGAEGLRPTNKASQYAECHGGPGVEHIAFYTDDIVAAMRALKARGADVVEWPATYYDIIRESLEESSTKIEESIDALQELNILIDYDSQGYLLQSFTKHTQARATVFLELIQRRNMKGFGAGNYKTVFDALQRLENSKNESVVTK